jgi:hypothetical protein
LRFARALLLALAVAVSIAVSGCSTPPLIYTYTLDVNGFTKSNYNTPQPKTNMVEITITVIAPLNLGGAVASLRCVTGEGGRSCTDDEIVGTVTLTYQGQLLATTPGASEPPEIVAGSMVITAYQGSVYRLYIQPENQEAHATGGTLAVPRR